MSLTRKKLNLQLELQLFNHWLLQLGKPLSHKEIKALKECKKAFKASGQDIIPQKAQDLHQSIKRFINKITEDKDKTRLTALSFHQKASTLINRIKRYLECDEQVTPAASRRLEELQSQLRSSIAWVRNTYNVPVIVRNGKAHRDEPDTEFDFETLRKHGRFDIRHQQRKHRFHKQNKTSQSHH